MFVNYMRPTFAITKFCLSHKMFCNDVCAFNFVNIYFCTKLSSGTSLTYARNNMLTGT